MKDTFGYHINANDIATSGAAPRWFLTTLLFPVGSTPSGIWHVMESLHDTCRGRGITLCGGHTEITDAVSRPVITGFMAGTVSRSGLIDKRNMCTGDKILLTKGVAVEGTAIIAREFGNRLLELGMTEEELRSCRQYLSDISILQEAKIASECPGVHAMQDIPEKRLQLTLCHEEKQVYFSVCDNGCGIPEENTEKIFTPFFSTHHGNGGTGLGLSIVKNIIEKHGGEIEVESHEGFGTTFAFKLPVA